MGRRRDKNYLDQVLLNGTAAEREVAIKTRNTPGGRDRRGEGGWKGGKVNRIKEGFPGGKMLGCEGETTGKSKKTGKSCRGGGGVPLPKGEHIE